MAHRHRTLVVAATTFLAVLSALVAPLTLHLRSASAVGSSAEVAVFWSLDDGPIAEFTTARAARSPGWLDWSSDGCSTTEFGPGDTGRTFNFRAACRRHDFGYRNLRFLERRHGVAQGTYWNRDTRLRIDRRFLADMRADCAPRPLSQRLTCRTWARTYYTIVRAFGGP